MTFADSKPPNNSRFSFGTHTHKWAIQKIYIMSRSYCRRCCCCSCSVCCWILCTSVLFFLLSNAVIGFVRTVRSRKQISNAQNEHANKTNHLHLMQPAKNHKSETYTLEPNATSFSSSINFSIHFNGKSIVQSREFVMNRKVKIKQKNSESADVTKKNTKNEWSYIRNGFTFHIVENVPN